ncbi:MAG: hypothetical protein WCK02_08825 [Bacteroidota bacterium]
MNSKEIELNLTELVSPPKTDSISGRTFGQGYAQKKNIVDEISKGSKFKIVIDDNYIKAINDSFWKGLFSELFRKYKTKERVESFFTFKANEYFKKHIEKNLTILDAIFNV